VFGSEGFRGIGEKGTVERVYLAFRPGRRGIFMEEKMGSSGWEAILLVGHDNQCICAISFFLSWEKTTELDLSGGEKKTNKNKGGVKEKELPSRPTEAEIAGATSGKRETSLRPQQIKRSNVSAPTLKTLRK